MIDNIEELSSYDYELPKELIASSPMIPKEEAKLLVYERKTAKISHYKFRDLIDILPKCSIVFNDTKVIKARIYGQKQSGGKIELLLNSFLDDDKFSVFIKGRVKNGDILNFNEGLKAVVLSLLDDGLRVVKFSKDNLFLNKFELFNLLEKIGHMPLPPYIKRQDEKDDEIWYQSSFAKNIGAVAAPTASLHFSKELLEKLSLKHKLYYITLHVGAGTFKPVEVENIKEHKMHSEWFNIPKESAKLLSSNEPILGVGTTVTRVVEEFARSKRESGECNLFLNLYNRPKRLNYLLTNFHLPKSTLIMLVSSFVGLQEVKEIYRVAIENRYRFYSYGDAMLVL